MSESLRIIAGRINAREVLVQQHRAQAVSYAGLTVAEVVEQGKDLAKIKELVPHGRWLTWLEKHCPKVSARSAQRYMAVAAKAPRVADLSEAESLRGALALCELEGRGSDSRAPEKNEPASGPKQWPPYLEAIGRVTKLSAYIKKHPVSDWPTEGKESIREELLPLAAALWPDKFAAWDGTA